jgi:hypothetical protein
MKICTCLIPSPVSSHEMVCRKCGGKIMKICMFKGKSGYCGEDGAVKIGYYYYCSEHAAKIEEKT